METEGEIRGWEDGQGFDEYVGCGFISSEVRIELVPAGSKPICQ